MGIFIWPLLLRNIGKKHQFSPKSYVSYKKKNVDGWNYVVYIWEYTGPHAVVFLLRFELNHTETEYSQPGMLYNFQWYTDM